MLAFILWYIAITLLGWIAFPIAYRVLGFLPDRGYTSSRAFGWLLIGYGFWISGSLGINRNNLGGIVFTLVVILVISYFCLRGVGWAGIKAWVKEQRKLILWAEGVFLITFAAWAFVRATMPEISGTEKPMELAFINAITTSPIWPPQDPWLSGYAISYYYFGYVLVSVLIRFTGVSAGIAFNLTIALLFGLTALGAYGLIFNLLHARKWTSDRQTYSLYTLPLLGPLFLLLVSNLEGFLEVLHARGLFWQTNSAGELKSGFWQWLGILELDQPPPMPFSWIPSRPGGVLWWRASRVVSDYGFDGSFREVIDEFPFFSYLLGDLHPHVLAMPFAILAIGLAFNIFLRLPKSGESTSRPLSPLPPIDMVVSALILGGLGFLNTWDFPIYVALFSGAYTYCRSLQIGWSWVRLKDFIWMSLVIGVLGVILYLPFYTGFSSQANGILPSLGFFTRGVHFWVMFAPLLIPIFIWLISSKPWNTAKRWLNRGISLSAALVFGLWLISFLLAGLITTIERGRGPFLANQGSTSQDVGILIREAFLNRLSAPGTWITLLILLSLVVLLFDKQRPKNPHTYPENRLQIEPANPQGFVLLLVWIGGLLVLAPEFFYLWDMFGGRMNTIFKLYFQTWIIWSLAAAYGSAVLLQDLPRTPGLVFRLGLIALLGVSLAYPALMLPERMGGLGSQPLTLDGTSQFRAWNPDEAAAIDWLKTAPPGPLVEAVGPQYSEYARFATFSGVPNLLGWPGHESQWRGGTDEMGNRQADIEVVYQTNDWELTQQILNSYGIRYVVIGNLERNTYPVNQAKFERFMVPVFQEGSVVIYEMPGYQDPVLQTRKEIQPG